MWWADLLYADSEKENRGGEERRHRVDQRNNVRLVRVVEYSMVNKLDAVVAVAVMILKWSCRSMHKNC
jgi:hypothetical protein